MGMLVSDLSQVFGFTFPPIFVPDVFIPKVPRAQKKLEDMTAEQREHFEEFKKTLVGDESERACFGNLRRLLTVCNCPLSVKRGQEGHQCILKGHPNLRIFSFAGTEFLYPDAEYKKTLTAEFDNIFIIDALKAIVYCELKGTFSKSHALKKKQFERFKSLIGELFPLGEGWRILQQGQERPAQEHPHQGRRQQETLRDDPNAGRGGQNSLP